MADKKRKYYIFTDETNLSEEEAREARLNRKREIEQQLEEELRRLRECDDQDTDDVKFIKGPSDEDLQNFAASARLCSCPTICIMPKEEE